MSQDAIVLGMERLAGLSWGDPETRVEMRRLLAPWDTDAHAEEMASAQSNCAIAVCAALLIAEVDGLVRAWRGKPQCDPLRELRTGHYDAIMYLEHLALQRGIHRPAGRERPVLGPATWFRIGGSPELGGQAHVGMCVGEPDADGWAPTVEGGQEDPLNPRKGAEKCTAIRRKRRRITGGPGRWTIDGRVIAYTADAGTLPTCADGMPWARIGIEP